MYLNIKRRRVPLHAHAGGPHDFLARFRRDAAEARRQGEDALQNFCANLPTCLADTRNLLVAYEHLQRGGQAPGPDCIGLGDLSKSEWCELFRKIGPLLADGSYRPGPTRNVTIQKSGGGIRRLRLANMIDRIVARALEQLLQPLWNPGFHPRSFGFRPGRSAWDALARAARLTIRGPRECWVANDLQSAFDRVPRKRLLQLLAQRGLPQSVVGLVERLVATPNRNGIAQGCSLSPLLLNLYLDRHLDRPWQQQQPDIPLLRYADDLLLLCDSQDQARRAATELRSLLTPAGFELKHDDDVALAELSAAPARWLGYEVSSSGGSLAVRIAPQAWDSLAESLDAAQLAADSVRAVDAVAHGWLSYLGPCYGHEDRGAVITRARDCIRSAGFDDPPPRQQLREAWRQAWRRWVAKRKSLAAGRRSRKAAPAVAVVEDECPF